MTEQERPNIPLPSGYRVMPKQDQELFDEITTQANDLGVAITAISNLDEGLTDKQIAERKRWAAIARTQLQQGFMALKRAVALPTNF